MPDPFDKKLRYEIQQIDRLLDSFDPLLEAVETRDPDLVELSALAAVLHSFYGGVEGIFSMIAKNRDDQLPSGAKWHKDLLDQMARPTKDRSPVVGNGLHAELIEYLSFRHFFRNSYAYELDWDQLRPLVQSIKVTWNGLKQSLLDLLDSGRPNPEDSP